MTWQDDMLQRARSWDEAALTEIFDQFSPAIYRYAYRLLGDAQQAEECVGETFARFLSALHNGGGPNDHLQAYLYRVAHNWITDQYRRQPPPPIDLEQHSESLPDPQSSPEELSVENGESTFVRSALRLLTAEQRQVIMLRFFEQQNLEETAAALGKPIGAIKALQHRALAALQRLLVPEKDGIE